METLWIVSQFDRIFSPRLDLGFPLSDLLFRRDFAAAKAADQFMRSTTFGIVRSTSGDTLCKARMYRISPAAVLSL
jgi:hypothetical protein